MKKVASQYELLRKKIASQAHLVFKKFKPTSSREVSNQDITLLLAEYSTNFTGTLSEEKIEQIHACLIKLSEGQMQVVKLKYWEGKSLREIGDIVGKSHQWVHDTLEQAYEKMRA